jgi:tetratricopeptide (TPR) repeat protein
MRRRFNSSFLLALLGGAALLGLGVHLLHEWQVKRCAASFLRQADRARAEQNLDAEIDSLGKYLAYFPKDGEAQERYGLALDARGRGKDSLQAFLVLERVVRESPGRDDVRRALARLAVKIERFDDALVHLNQLVKAAEPDGELEYLLGQCREGKGDYQAAAVCFARALDLPPRPLDAYVRLAQLYRVRLNKPALADDVMGRLVSEKKSAEAYLSRARYLRERSAREDFQDDAPRLSPEVQAALVLGAGPSPLGAAPWLWAPTYDSPLLRLAGEDLAHARRLAPQDPKAALDAAELAESQARFLAARRLAEESLELDPNQPGPYLFLARLEARLNRRPEGLAWLDRGLQTLPRRAELLYLQSDLLIDEGKLEESEKVLALLRDQGVDPAALQLMEGRLHCARQEWPSAIRTLEDLQPRLARSPDLARQVAFLLGRCYEEVGDADQQYAAYRRAGADDPSGPRWVEISWGLGRALAAMNKVDDALEVFRRLARRVPGARATVARLLIVRNLSLPRPQRRWEEVEQALNDAEREAPRSTEVRLLRVQAWTAQDRFAEAQALLAQGRKEEPRQADFWAAEAGLALRRQQLEKAVEILDEATRQLGDHVELRLARAWYWGQRGGPEAAPQLRRLAEGLDAFSAEDRRRLRRGVTDALTRVGAYADARALAARLADERPHDLGVKLALFELALLEGNQDLMAALVREMQELEGPDGCLWRYAQAQLTICQCARGPADAERLREARRLLAHAAARRPAWSRIPACQAAVEELSRNEPAALTYLLRAIDLGERNPEAVGRALRLLYKRERYDEAGELLRKLPDQASSLRDLKEAAVDLSLRNRDYEQALSLAQKALADDPRDFRAHLWLAHVHWAMNPRSAEVEPALRQALALADGAPEACLPLIQFLIYTGEKAKAEQEAAAAARRWSRTKQGAALAQCCELVGKLDEARELYEERLRAAPGDPALLRAAAFFDLRHGRAEEGKRRLRRILDLDARSPEAAAARRVIWMVEATEGDYHKTEALIASMGAGGPEGRRDEESLEDLRARVLLLYMQGRRQDRQEAARLLEGLRQREPLTPVEQFLLARLYDTLGDWGKAKAEALSLLGKKGDDLNVQAFYALALLRHGETDEAAAWLARMERLPEAARRDSFALPEVKARLLAARGKGAEAAELLAAHVEGHPSHAGDAAALLDQLRQPTAAEKMYRKLVAQSKTPEAAGLLFAQFLGRQKRVGEALELCEKAWAKVPPEAVAQACAVVLYTGAADDRQCEQAAHAIEAALKKSPNSAPLRTHLANVRNLQGRYDEVERLYQDAVRLNAQDALALNNLAFLLALEAGKADRALPLIQRAVALQGPRADFLDTRAVVQLALGKTELAIKDLREATAERETATASFHLAQAYQRGGNRDAARGALKHALSLGLTEQTLHQLERPAYRRLRAELDEG